MHTDEKKEHAKKPKERLRGALWFGDHQTSLVPVFCPSLAPKWPNEVIRINVSHFLLSAGERPQTMVWNSVNTFHWLMMLRKLLMEKSDSLNINQMDVFFVDLCSFISVSETLYSRKKRIAICYRRNQNQATVEGLLLVISLKINGREEHQRAV